MRGITLFKIFLLVLLLTDNAIAEEVYNLFSKPGNGNAVSEKSEIQASEQEKKGIINIGKFNENVKKITHDSKVAFDLKDKKILFKIDRIVKKGVERFSFSASSADRGNIHISENNGRVVGSMNYAGKLFKIRPDENGDTVLIEVPKEELIDHDEAYQENYNYLPLIDQSLIDFGSVAEASDSDSEFTVIVAYTSNFANSAGDIAAYMDLLELETNMSYENSAVKTRVKIVHSYQTDYSDSGDFVTDIISFSNTSNAHTRQLYNLRNQYNADIMMLLTGNNYSACGRSRAVGATEQNALAAVRESCATGYYSFGHEIGHLFGARHIISQDPSMTPFPYGHGYCNVTPGTWRTVMAPNCPQGTGGSRIQYWSNPDISIQGQATGTRDIEFCAKVMNVRAAEVANFRVSPTPNLAWLIPDLQ
ncbi:M12 family metallo-peptidase [Microbulbifer sp. 2205BS26-8]|uniref:M12 family metallo-peptidase n=1 Tax=Microbulbifer sp. 2205BS26-8 TaxID=3064386 RepID=UPI00273E85AF|nr:M12 family metallo-peptidase [Microbulbifer sp. 2205BS26-8]MDP5210347.1 M12 family metallo-peptidase [Microbulbifer sp. 2205BS26-8]